MTVYHNEANDASHVLLVEGQDDKHMVGQLCGQCPLFSADRSGHDWSATLISNSQTFAIKETGSQSELLDAIRLEVAVSGRKVLGMVLDADPDLEKCWANIGEKFSQTRVQLPVDPDPAGTIVHEQDLHPRIGIWLMPDNNSMGELENFALRMMPRHDAIWPLSRSYIDNIPEDDRKFLPSQTDKAKLYAWLATRKEPGRMGAAVGAGDLEINGPLCRNFFDWLVRLLE